MTNTKDLESKRKGLMSDYRISIEFTSGCGSQGQGYIDKAYEKLTDFAEKHSEYKSRLPKKTKCGDDGTFGVASGLPVFGSSMRREY